MAGFQGITAIAALIVILASAQVVAEPVRVRAASHDDFGRIVFTWGSPVGHNLNIEDGGALIRFSRPIESSYTNVVRGLSKYLTKVSPGDDGRSVWFALTGSYDVYSYDSGHTVVVEIAEKEGDSGIAKTTPEPEAGGEAAGEAQKVPGADAADGARDSELARRHAPTIQAHGAVEGERSASPLLVGEQG